MPLWNNPEVQKLMTNPSASFQQMGLMVPRQTAGWSPSPASPWGQPGYRVGDWMGAAIEDKQLLKPVGSYMTALNSNPRMAALMSALGLGALGAGYGMMTNRDPLLWGGIGAGVGAAGGYGLSSLMQYMEQQRNRRHLQEEQYLKKYGFYVSNGEDPKTYIQSRLFADPSLDPSTKSQLILNVQQLPPDQLVSLAGLLRTAVGAGVGYLISRFLLNLGPVGKGISAGVGGLLGAMLGRGRNTQTNVFGEDVDTRFDPFGRPRLVY